MTKAWAITVKEFVLNISLTENGVDLPLKAYSWMSQEEVESLKVSKIVPRLKLLATSGRLSFDKKPLAINFFQPVTFFYDIDGNDEAEIFVKIQEKLITLKEVTALVTSPQILIIYRNSLYFTEQQLSPKDLQRAFKGLKITIDDEMLDLLSQEEPPVTWKRAAKIAQLEPVCLPILHLIDKLGSFAKLEFTTHNPLQEKSWEKDLLETGYQIKGSQYYCPSIKVVDTLYFLLDLGWKIIDYKGRELTPYTQSTLFFDVEEGKVSVKGQLHFEKETIDVTTPKESHFIPLSDTKVGLLPKRGLDAQLDLVNDHFEIVSDRLQASPSTLNKLIQIEEKHLLNYSQRLLNLLSQGSNTKPAAAFVGHLRDYQQKGLEWLYSLYESRLGALLADDMGLGKTVQVLAFLSNVKEKEPALIVVPTSLIFHWERQFKQFLPSYKLLTFYGQGREFTTSCDAIITTYGTLKQDLNLFSLYTYSTIIIDEAQAIKNEKTKISQSLNALKSSFRISMTGTPIENHIGELKAQFDFLLPGLLQSEDLLKEQQLKKKVSPFILRRIKSEVASELPPIIDETVLLEMGEDQKKLYQAFQIQGQKRLIDKTSLEGSTKKMEIFELLLRLRQICCHPLLISQEHPSAKLDQLLIDLEEILDSGQKVILFSQFTSFLKLIKNSIAYDCLYLDGETKNRSALVDQFQNDKNSQLFLISLKAGGAGLHLTAADYIFLLDPWWNEAVEAQAIGRAHRIGRDKPVVVTRYILKDTIEEKMVELKIKKAALSDGLFEETPSLTEEEIALLFS